MASVFKCTYLTPIPEGAQRCLARGVPSVRHTDGKGRVQVRPIKLDEAGKETGKMVCEQRTWWMKYTLPGGLVKREKGFTDRLATEQEAARREREAQQAAAGLLVVSGEHLATPLKQHVDTFIEELRRLGRDDEYYERVDRRLHIMLRETGWQTLRQINPDDMTRFLMTLQQKGLAAKTQNEYLAGAKTFCNWCVRTRRLAANPLASVTKTRNVEKTYRRRALTHEEAERLLDVAPARRLIYRMAIYTGLRRTELKDLQLRDLVLDSPSGGPHIRLRAAATKARRADVVALREDLAEELRAAMPKDAQPTDTVFSSVPPMETFLLDLERARIPHEDGEGRVVDFHSLRYTCGTWLAQAGTAPRVAMEVMRHTDMKLTMNLYTDPTLLNTAGAVSALPSLYGPNAQKQKNRAG
ncbi:MAG: tyrosine-type recombinase/integrase [Planctomycetota bacterium]|nr:tyrosine-type recombinase/integrase [Planctomycetota bacterium]